MLSHYEQKQYFQNDQVALEKRIGVYDEKDRKQRIKDASSANADAAKAFMDFLQTQEAKDKFVEYGFTLHE